LDISNLKKLILLSLIFFVWTAQLFAQRVQAVNPQEKVRNYVTDKSSILTPGQIQLLESKLSNFEKETSNQVVVYIIPSLNGESLEETSYDIAAKNGIGQKGKDNGVLLFIVTEDRKLRIEVGYGLEGVLPDALAGQIIRKEITPYFKQGKYYEGINAGVDAIIAATKGEYTADKKTSEKEEGFNVGICGLPVVIFFLFFGFGFFFIFSMIHRIFGWGGGSGSGTWWNSGGWSSGSGSSWSSGSSFGGFSGGGGSFGGGGASGSW
jgi:uncharacterized protein